MPSIGKLVKGLREEENRLQALTLVSLRVWDSRVVSLWRV